MLRLASWIRESDDAHFGQFFSLHPDLRLQNARVAEIDLDHVDGVLISGGPDIAAEFHVEPPKDLSLIQDPEPQRDQWEFSAVQYAVENRLPLLCICKGFQVLNVALGGTLLLDIDGHDLPEMKMQNIQPLRYAAGARHQFPMVNSSHHQAIDRLADGLEVEAWCSDDGIIEQVRLLAHPWARGVQYHPERDPLYVRLFEDFFAQVRLHASTT